MVDKPEVTAAPRFDEQVDEKTQATLTERLKGILGRLESEANSRVGKRQALEKRWIEDLEQYHGRYDEKTRKELENGAKSKLFINMTRPKTDAMSARLMDLLFPTDDRNWGIQPTPVPELTEAAQKAVAQERAIVEQAKAEAEQQGGVTPDTQAKVDEAKKAAAALQAAVEESRKRAELMEREIDDQLKESIYHAAMRDLLEDGCKLGTGVCKGPVTGDKVRKGWKKEQIPSPDGRIGADGQPVMIEGPGHKLEMSTGETPAMRYVDLWSFFPDMDARNIGESQGVFERHLMNKKKLRALAHLSGFEKDAIRKLITQNPSTAAPSYLADLRNLTETNTQVTNDLYHVWEYSGPIEAEDMRDIALAMGDEATLNDIAEVDPLTELNVVMWFCQGEVLKFAIYPFDSGECMYSVFNLARDEASIFGYGIPAIMRDPQKSLNGGWRAMMDNAGLATGPQIVIAKGLIEPADGDWNLKPRKIWLSKEGLPQNHRAFDSFDIQMHQAELANIIVISQKLIDDMTAMPAIAQGDQGTGITKTAQGMALLMNSANVVFRRIVKNFDDDVTTPNIRRFYDWNMQFNPKEEIKGDYNVDARGSSVLLVREMQAQNLMIIAIQLGAHPVYGPMLKNRDVLRMLFRAHMIPADEVVLTDDEIDAVLMDAAAQQAELAKAASSTEAEDRKIDAQIQISNADNDTKMKIATLNRETALIEMASRLNMNLDQLEGKLTLSKHQTDSKERIFASEAALEAQNAAAAKANGTDPKGSGGYISAE